MHMHSAAAVIAAMLMASLPGIAHATGAADSGTKQLFTMKCAGLRISHMQVSCNSVLQCRKLACVLRLLGSAGGSTHCMRTVCS